MRYGLLVLSIALCIGLYLGWFTRAYDHLTTAALSEEARLALAVGCRGRKGHAERECRGMLQKLYLSGSLDPDRTLRAYCEEIEHARWGGSRPPAPKLCVKRYGGWHEG